MSETCFAMGNNSACHVLLYKRCIGFKRCHFFRTPEEYNQSVQKCAKRIAGLSDALQFHFCEKYNLTISGINEAAAEKNVGDKYHDT